MPDAVLPFPVLLSTIVVVSLMLILENQNTEQQCEQVIQSVVIIHVELSKHRNATTIYG